MVQLSQKDAAARLNITPSGLKYLELRGDVHPTKNSAGRRTYDPREIARLLKQRARKAANA
jgi:DNA-binding transcriptional MerR regulator